MGEAYPDNIDRMLMQEQEGRYFSGFFRQPAISTQNLWPRFYRPPCCRSSQAADCGEVTGS